MFKRLGFLLLPLLLFLLLEGRILLLSRAVPKYVFLQVVDVCLFPLVSVLDDEFFSVALFFFGEFAVLTESVHAYNQTVFVCLIRSFRNLFPDFLFLFYCFLFLRSLFLCLLLCLILSLLFLLLGQPSGYIELVL